MLRRIWQWLKALFRRLFGGETRLPDSSHRQQAYSTAENAPASKPLDDSDYEYLFMQLLEGMAHGWQEERVVHWFESLKGRITYTQWVGWLDRFGARVLASSLPNHELALRLLRLSEMLQSARSLEEIGEVTYHIGQQLLNREPSGSGTIWDYEGPDADATASSLPSTPASPGEQSTQQEAASLETITLDELFARLQQDTNLAQLVAQQFGLETTDPEVIIQEVINQFNSANHAAMEQAGDWFNLGVQQDQSGDFAGAIASYNQALEIRADLYEVWFNRGNALSNLGQLEEAIASYDKAIEFNPDFQEAWHNRGNALSMLGRLEEAKASFDKAKELQAD